MAYIIFLSFFLSFFLKLSISQAPFHIQVLLITWNNYQTCLVEARFVAPLLQQWQHLWHVLESFRLASRYTEFIQFRSYSQLKVSRLSGFIQFWSYSHLEVPHLSAFRDFTLMFLIRSYSPSTVRRCHTFSVMFQWLMFVSVIFSVTYKFFVHIHSVILNWSIEYSSSVLMLILF